MNQNQVRFQVQHVRRTIRWSQYDLANASGIGRTRISLFETGRVELRPGELDALQNALRDATSQRVSEFQNVLSGDLAWSYRE
jgi:transcriptional regulator with XRE-family HTH domain